MMAIIAAALTVPPRYHERTFAGSRMRKVFFSSLLCGLCATAAFAQPASSTDAYNGKWNVTIQRSGDKPHTAKLVLTGYSGTWYNVTTADRTKAKVCDGKKFPVTVQES